MAFAAFLDRIFPTDKMIKDNVRTDQPVPPGSEIAGELMRVAWPSIVEHFMLAVITMVDSMMVGTLGYQSIAAVNLTNQPRMILLAVIQALNVGVTAIISRRKGQEDREGANRLLRQIIFLYAGLALVLSVIAVVFAYPIMEFCGAQPDSIEEGVIYFRIVIGGIIFNILNLGINAAQRGVGKTKISMKTNVTANLVNLTFNWLLIGGNLGFPAWGVAGAAFATTLGYVVAFCMSLRAITRKDAFLKLDLRQKTKFNWRELKPVVTIGTSAGVEQVCMRIGFLIFSKIIASLGTMAYSTYSICQNINRLSFCFGNGLGSSASALLGQSIGRKRYDVATLYGRIAQRIGMALGIVVMFGMGIWGRNLILLFTDEPAILELGSKAMYILAILPPLHISQSIFVNNLRVSGDVKYTTWASFWCITIVRTVTGYIFCILLDWGVVGAWLSFLVDQSLRLILFATRFLSNKWIQIRIEGEDP